MDFMKKYLILSLLITAFNHAMVSSNSAANQSALGKKKSKEEKGAFFEQHPKAHAALYALYHTLGSSVFIASGAHVGDKATFNGIKYSAAPYFSDAPDQNASYWALAPSIVAFGVSGYLIHKHQLSTKILDAGWTTCGLSKPDNAEEIAKHSNDLGCAIAVMGTMAVLVKLGI